MKYTLEEKLKYVRMYKRSERIALDPKAKGSVRSFRVLVRNWARAYDLLGEDGLVAVKTRKSYRKEEKLSAVKMVLSGKTVHDVAVSLGIRNGSVIAVWVKTYKALGEDGLESKPRGRKPNGKRPGKEGSGEGGGGAAEAELPLGFRELLSKKIEGLGGAGGATPRQKCEAIIQVRKEFKEATLRELLEIAKMSKSTFFYELHRKPGVPEKEMRARELVMAVYEESKRRYGVRRITAVLNESGIGISRKRVHRIMRVLKIKGLQPRVKYNSFHGSTSNVAPDLIIMEYTRKDGQVHHKSDFSCDGPDQKWTTDVSQFNFSWGKCYISPIKDMFTGEIISFNLSMSPNLEQVMDMLDKAFEGHPDLKGLIFHSDQGWQYQHQAYVDALKEKEIRQSMSRKGNCLDNCIMESFFARMKTEMYYGREDTYKSFEEFKSAVSDYIEWHNNKRIRYYPRLKRFMTPAECRKAYISGQTKKTGV